MSHALVLQAYLYFWYFLIVSADYCYLLLVLLPVYHFGDGYGKQAVFTAPFSARSFLARLGSSFLLVAVNAKDYYTEVK